MMLKSLVFVPLANAKEFKFVSYSGNGGGGGCSAQFECWEKDLIEGVTLRGTKSKTINAQTLKGYDALCLPGGLIGYEKYLDKQAIRDFVKAGGGFYGTCAGAYAGCKSWGATADQIMAANPEYFVEGYNMSNLESNQAIGVTESVCDLYYHVGDSPQMFTELGHKVYPKTQDGLVIDHHNGPAMKVKGTAQLLATFGDGARKGSSSMLVDKYGEGNVILISPHPEHTHNQNCEVVTRAAAYAVGVIGASDILV